MVTARDHLGKPGIWRLNAATGELETCRIEANPFVDINPAAVSDSRDDLACGPDAFKAPTPARPLL
jgi:hypothetical protein